MNVSQTRLATRSQHVPIPLEVTVASADAVLSATELSVAVIILLLHHYDSAGPWRRQDLLRGGAKLKIMSWGTHGKL